ncbi:hypothetical protein FRC20_009971 [Serendipita sp. 405]|nr:hypothetical protein FRC20_009971 [Serendipita sp. 405]
MGDFRPPHPEALLLSPVDIAPTLHLNFDVVTTNLYRQSALTSNVPYRWGFIDKPKEGEIFVIFHRGGPLTDGLMFLEQEHSFLVPKQGQGPDIECYEAKQGFIPGQDSQAFRIRRRYHFIRPHNPNVWLVHYSRSPTPVPVAMHLHQQIRQYPLPNLPALNTFIGGNRMGEMAHEEEARQIIAAVQARAPEAFYNPQRGGPHHSGPPIGYGGMPQDISSQTAILRELERKKRMIAPPVRRDEEDSPDEDAAVSVRTLALSRYKRNHELMEEVFHRAAFGTRRVEEPSSSTPGMTLEEITSKLAATQASIDKMEAKLNELRRLKEEKEQAAEVMMS